MPFGQADDATDVGLDKSVGRNSDSANASLSAQLWEEVGKLPVADNQTKASMDSGYTNLELNTSSLYDTKWHQYTDAGDKGGGGGSKPDASEAKAPEKEKPADKAPDKAPEKAVEKEPRSPIPVDRLN